ncbi:MAG: hypothetical protein IJP77_06090 [Bacteroidales bacterium]|nr:hypothetical protein [Bacteroidales bacterium]
MAKMKHLDGYAPSAKETKKLNKIVSWLKDNGYRGIMMIQKGEIAVSWTNIEDSEEVRHSIINFLGHVAEESEEAAVAIAHGMMKALKQIQ